MEINVIALGATMGALALGSIVGYYTRQTIAKNQLSTAEGKANNILDKSKKDAQEKILEAKNKAVEILEEAKNKEKEKENQIEAKAKRLEKREEFIDRKMEELDKGKDILRTKAQEIKKTREKIKQIKEDELKRLEKIAGFKKGEAKKILLQLTEEEYGDVLVEKIKKLEQHGAEQLEEKSKNIMTQVIQKYAGKHTAEITTSTISIPSDEIKGKIIGREGRNIKALEKLTGVEIIIDDTPETIVISSFEPIRRETARIALTKLIDDGRIHPARIEEAVELAKKEIDKKVKEAGEAAAYDVGVAGLDSKIIYLLGKLRFRTSYGQNVLIHSIEVAHLSGALAEELGADVAIAKKAGLLHDIGKAVDHQIQGTHVKIGMKILEKLGVDEEIIDAMKSHHEEYPFGSRESFIVAAADAISAGRPGARKDTLEKYLKRLEELEGIANSFNAVGKSYAIQAGREIRVFVNSEKVDDYGSIKLAKEIADKIEDELKYPGEIKVNVLREVRAVEYAR